MFTLSKLGLIKLHVFGTAGWPFSPLSFILLLLVTVVGAVLLITLCNGGLAAVKALWNRLFGPKN